MSTREAVKTKPLTETFSQDQEREKIAETCVKIQQLKRIRDQVLKSRITVENRLASCTATILGYESGMTPKERKAHWQKAKLIVIDIMKQHNVSSQMSDDEYVAIYSLVDDATGSLNSFAAHEKKWALKMETTVRLLPIWPWAKQTRGVGELTLANIIGETGDMFNYDNPAKVWKRMGCAPLERDGEVHTGMSWRIGKWHKKKLTNEDWVSFGYSPKRRSVIYNLAVGIIMQCSGKNSVKDGANNPFMQRFHEAKKVAKEKHPDWTDMHVLNHARLLMGKRFLRDMWIEWTNSGENKPVYQALGNRIALADSQSSYGSYQPGSDE